MLLKEGREEIRLRNNITDQEYLVEVMGKVLVTNECRMQIEKKRHLDIRPTIHSKWDGSGGPGV